MQALFRFRRFRTRLVVLMVGLLALVQVTAYLLVARANQDNALATISERLAQAARQFRNNAALREKDLLVAARVMAGDYAMKQLFLAKEFSAATARSALSSYQARIEAPLIVLLDPAGDLLAGTRSAITSADLAPFAVLREAADRAENQQATGYGFFDGELHQIVLVPLLAPPPEVVAWVGVGFPINAETAAELKRTSSTEVSFLAGSDAPRVLASTLPPRMAEELTRSPVRAGTNTFTLGGKRYVTTFEPLLISAAEPALIALQRSVEDELAPSRELERVILIVFVVGLCVAIIAALWLARNLSQPVQQLAGATKQVAAGDYSRRIKLDREDELGQLARDFNHMTTGLAERDRVRDLLGKVVSPEIAAQLMASELKLGGEEREVTILFSDIRAFTTLSEKMAPTELLELLNRYLDRMSAVIERHGGVVDKYIGDAIMALFGAPIATDDGATRAISAAREMVVALEELNRKFAHEGKPTLAIGIGINTARVIAGNMGSKTRLNYTVIGDGVNLAARLQTLTKEKEYQTQIIVSEATAGAAKAAANLRPLGSVTVKGRTEAVRIYAVDSTAQGERGARL